MAQSTPQDTPTALDTSHEDTVNTVLVLGATGATGRHVVKKLLARGQRVQVVVRSEQRLSALLADTSYDDQLLKVTEANLLDLTEKELEKLTRDVDAVVQCLGHKLTFEGIWGQPRDLVTQAVQRITQALRGGIAKKFILMGSDGVAQNGDDERPWYERAFLAFLRYAIPPHYDNEQAAAYLMDELGTSSNVAWVVVRPTDLVDYTDESSVTDQYQVYDKPQDSLFGSGVATRSNVAQFMTDLVTNQDLFDSHQYHMPVVHDKKVVESDGEEKNEDL